LVGNVETDKYYIPCYEDTKSELAVPIKYYGEYVFSWDEISGKENEGFLEFLIRKFGIGWIKNAKLDKIDNSKTIKANTEKNSFLLKLSDKRTEAILEIDDVRTDKFMVKMEMRKINIYKLSI
jgi:hypothetical protein